MTTVPISARLMVLRIRLNSGKYLKLLSVYTQLCSVHKRKRNTDSLRCDRNDLYFILGDIKERVGSDWRLWPNVLWKHGIRRMNANGLMLLHFCTQKSFTIMGSVFQLPNKLKNSWQHLQSKHQIDHILAKPETRSHISVTKTSNIFLSFSTMPQKLMKQSLTKLNSFLSIIHLMNQSLKKNLACN